MSQVMPTLPQMLDCMDVFGASERVAATWQDAGYNAMSYDIKINPSHDIVSEAGFKCMLRMALQFFVRSIEQVLFFYVLRIAHHCSRCRYINHICIYIYIYCIFVCGSS